MKRGVMTAGLCLAALTCGGWMWMQPYRPAPASTGGGSTLGIGLVAHWKCNDDAASTTVADTKGNNLTATTDTSNMHAAGKVGTGALTFSATDYASGTFSGFPTTAMTFAAWGYLSGGGNWFCEKGATSDGEWGCYINGIWFWTMSADLGGGWGDGDGVTISDMSGTWNHFAIIWDGTTATFYTNGASAGTAGRSGTITSRGSTVWLGIEGAWNSVNFSGQMDDVRIYNRAISESELVLIYNSGSGTEDE